MTKSSTTKLFALPCVLTEEEYQEKSKELTRLLREKAKLEEQKAASARSYKEQIDKTELEIDDLLPLVESGTETREIECRIDYNTPTKGEKTITRLDTMEIVETLEMTDDEKSDMFINAEDEDETETETEPIPFKKAK